MDQRGPGDGLAGLSRLVDAGETLELIGRLNTICATPRRNGVLAVDGAGAAEATPAPETV